MQSVYRAARTRVAHGGAAPIRRCRRTDVVGRRGCQPAGDASRPAPLRVGRARGGHATCACRAAAHTSVNRAGQVAHPHRSGRMLSCLSKDCSGRSSAGLGSRSSNPITAAAAASSGGPPPRSAGSWEAGFGASASEAAAAPLTAAAG